jgi:predicted dehydrogenase
MQAAAATGVALALPRFSRAAGPNEKLNVASIGVTGQGASDLDGVAAHTDQVNIVALCDVDSFNIAKAAERYPSAKRFDDYRKMYDVMHKDIDAVIVATPDHHHAFATMGALKLGKHVYCEKPLTHSVWECRRVREEAAKNPKLATQMGTQIHAGDNYRRVVELIQAGAIGKVERVHVWVGGAYHGGDRPTEIPPVPANLNWDLWLGPAPERPYHNTAYHPFWWRGWWDFGGGTLADMACHHVDLPYWALDLRAPDTVEADGSPLHPEGPAKILKVHYRFPARGERPPVHLTWYHGDGNRPEEFAQNKVPGDWGNGCLFVGEGGKMLVADYGQHRLLPEEQFKDYQRPAATIPSSIGHHTEWIKACREGTPTLCNFDYSGALTEAVLLGNVAFRSGKKVTWDAANLKTGSAEADAQLRREYRKGWEL